MTSPASGGLLRRRSILNIPYNIFADIVNIPYTESQALAEYAYALGPAGSTGGVEGWIPPGATVADGGVSHQGGLIHRGRDRQLVDGIHRQHMGLGQRQLAAGGRADALCRCRFSGPKVWPSPSSLSRSRRSSMEPRANCEFQCSSLLGYLGGWITHLGNVFFSTYPTTKRTPSGKTSQNILGDIINVGPPGSRRPLRSGPASTLQSTHC